MFVYQPLLIDYYIFNLEDLKPWYNYKIFLKHFFFNVLHSIIFMYQQVCHNFKGKKTLLKYYIYIYYTY